MPLDAEGRRLRAQAAGLAAVAKHGGANAEKARLAFRAQLRAEVLAWAAEQGESLTEPEIARRVKSLAGSRIAAGKLRKRRAEQAAEQAARELREATALIELAEAAGTAA